MIIIGYARVSKREQAFDSHALEQQQARLKTAGASKIWTDIQSGTRDDRQQFNEVMELVKSRQVDEVIVTRIDRLGRSLLSCRQALDHFRETKVKLTVLDGSIDLSTVSGRTQANMMAVWAEMESENISERARHGWEYLRHRQVAMNPPFGYIKVDNRHELDHQPFLCLIANQQELSKAAIARGIIDTFFVAKSLRATVKQVNSKYGIARFNYISPKSGFKVAGVFQWSPSGLKRWLTNPVLCGHLSYLRDCDQPIVIKNTHLKHRLVTDKEFQQIQSMIDHNQAVRGWGFRALKYPLSGLITCAECGGACYSLTAGTRGKGTKPRDYYYFQCKNYRMNACSQKKSVRMDIAESAVVHALAEKFDEIAAFVATPQEYVEPLELQSLRSQLSGLEQLGCNPAIDMAVAHIKQQIENYQSLQLTKIGINQELRQQFQEIFKNTFVLQSPNESEKSEIYRLFVQKVVVRDGQVLDVILKI